MECLQLEKYPARRPYQKPQVIYQDVLKTRAGSPLGDPEDDAVDPFDPASLFKD